MTKAMKVKLIPTGAKVVASASDAAGAMHTAISNYLRGGEFTKLGMQQSAYAIMLAVSRDNTAPNDPNKLVNWIAAQCKVDLSLITASKIKNDKDVRKNDSHKDAKAFIRRGVDLYRALCTYSVATSAFNLTENRWYLPVASYFGPAGQDWVTLDSGNQPMDGLSTAGKLGTTKRTVRRSAEALISASGIKRKGASKRASGNKSVPLTDAINAIKTAAGKGPISAEGELVNMIAAICKSQPEVIVAALRKARQSVGKTAKAKSNNEYLTSQVPAVFSGLKVIAA